MTKTYQKSRLTATLLLLAALLFSIKSWGQTNVTVENLTYDLNKETKTAAVAGLANASVRNLTIPGAIQVEGEIYDVTSIAAGAFSYYSIEDVTIPASVETIGDHAFNMCSNLETVTFEEGSKLKSIGIEAFAGFYEQDCVDVTEWGEPIFVDNYFHQLSSINLEECTQLETIGDFAFNISLISKIIIPASVKNIGTGVFYNPGYSLTVKFRGTTPPTFAETSLGVDKTLVPASALEAYQQVLSTNSNGVTTYYPAGEDVILDGIIYTVQADEDHYAVKEITESAITDGALTIPNKVYDCEVNSINEEAALELGSLTTLTIPASVETIGNNAFNKCRYLETVTFEEGSKLKSIGAGAFACGEFYEEFGWDPERLEPIMTYVTYHQLSSINLEACMQLETIGNEAFMYSKLSKIIIPASIKTIGDNVFADPEQPLTVKFRGTTPPTSFTYLYAAKILVPASALEAYQQKLSGSVTPYYFAGEEATVDGITYIMGEDEEQFAMKSVTGSAISAGAITIAKDINGYAVTSISSHALDNFDNEIEYIIVAEENYERLHSKAGGYENKVYVNGGTKALSDADELVLSDKYLYTIGNITYSRTFTEGEYATLCLPFEVTVKELKEEFAEVYLPQSNIIHNTSTDRYIMMLMTPQENTIAAGVPFFVKRNQEGEQTVTLQNAFITVLPTTLAPADKELNVVDWDGTSGLMTECTDISLTCKGTLATQTNFDETCYTFNTNGSFGNQRADANFPAYRMYLKASTTLPAQPINISILGDNNATGISALSATKAQPTTHGIYTLGGEAVEMNHGMKGIYIIDGKKVMMK